MAALTSSRQTQGPKGDMVLEDTYALEAATTCFLGSMVAIDANGYLVPAQVFGGSPLNVLRVIGVMIGTYLGFPGQDAVNLSSAVVPGTQQSAGAQAQNRIALRSGPAKAGLRSVANREP